MLTQDSTLPSRINPHAATAERHALAWASAHGLTPAGRAAHRRLAQVGVGTLVARAYPHASLEALLVCAEWLAWLFLYDDLCDESALSEGAAPLDRLQARLSCVLDGGALVAEDIPLVTALHDVYRHLRALGNEECTFRLARLMELHFLATRWQDENRAAGRIPELASYHRLRRHSGAVYTCFELIDLAAGINLPAEVRDDETVQRLGDLANDVISWCNDLVSLRKEEDDPHNLVTVLAHHERLTQEAALRRALTMHTEAQREFERLATELPRFSAAIDEQLARYVDGLRWCMRGNHDWSLSSARYQGAEISQPLAA